MLDPHAVDAEAQGNKFGRTFAAQSQEHISDQLPLMFLSIEVWWNSGADKALRPHPAQMELAESNMMYL